MDDCEAIRACVCVIALHLAAFEREVVKRLLTGNAKLGAGALPFRAMRVDAAAAIALVGDEVRQFVFERPPELFGFAVLELWVEFDDAIRPPRAASGGLHPWIP